MNKQCVEILSVSKDNPQCLHGPTLLFSREVKGRQKNFFACAACRERKYCNFFLWEDEKNSYKSDIWVQQQKEYSKDINHRKMFLTLNEVKKLSPQKRIYCQTCRQFVLNITNDKHKEHNLLTGITDNQLKCPSEMLPPLENSKMEAQYLFSKSSVEVIINIFKALGYRNVICIGTPRIHEYIQTHGENMTSILLDIDKRFHSFFGPLEFCWYNLFNDHFFFKESRNIFEDFLRLDNGKNTVLITDPPFGGRTEPITLTLNFVNERYQELNNIDEYIPIFWIFPYFMEPQILNWLPNFQMLDYKVDYENHPLFQDCVKAKKGSPVRIFTNVSPRLIKLPDDGYKFCKLCKKWVSNGNKHCKLCNACTSKDGGTYIHCSVCNKCVKSTWIHCNSCNRCALVSHKCGPITFSKECFNCKESGHKRIDCPYININSEGKRLKPPIVKKKEEKKSK